MGGLLFFPTLNEYKWSIQELVTTGTVKTSLRAALTALAVAIQSMEHQHVGFQKQGSPKSNCLFVNQ